MPEVIRASASGVYCQWGKGKDRLKTWCVGDSEGAIVCGDWSQLGHRGQLNCAIDCPLNWAKFWPCWPCCYVTGLLKAGSAQRWLDPNWIQILDVCELQWCNRKKSLQNNQWDRQDNGTNYPQKTVSIFIERFHIASCWLLIRQNRLNPQLQYINGRKDLGGQLGDGKADLEWIVRQLVGYTIAEIKSWISHEGDKYVDWRKIT